MPCSPSPGSSCSDAMWSRVRSSTIPNPRRPHHRVLTTSHRCRSRTERRLHMGLQHLWFLLLAFLFVGFFVLEGFDFGVGMLMEFFGRAGKGDREQHRRAALNTIGPVWDGNEVWLITAGGAMFAAFPGMYATVFSGLYLPLLAILFGMILRVCAIEWRGKIDDSAWRSWADIGIAVGSWLPAFLWGVAFAALVRGLPVNADHQVHLSTGDLLNPYTALGGLAMAGLFLFYGAVFVVLKTED